MLPQDVFAHRYRIEALTREKALLAILKPAEAFGLPVEESLRERLLDDLEDEAWQGQGLEPANLQIVLYRLYRDAVEQGLWDEQRKRGVGLTLKRYQDLGGTREILAGYLDEVLAEMPPKVGQQSQAWAILKSMVTAERTKAALSGQEIARGDLVGQVGLAEEELDKLLAYLRGRRVLRKFGDEAAEGGRYELAHEVMVEKVWRWFSQEELHLLDVRDLLRRELSSYQKFGYLLDQEKLDLIASCCEELFLTKVEQVLLLRSALATRHEVSFWQERVAPEAVRLVLLAGRGEADLLNPHELTVVQSRCKELALGAEEQELLLRSALAVGQEVPYWREQAPAVVGQVEAGLLEKLSASEAQTARQAVQSLGQLASPKLVRRLGERVEAGFGDEPISIVDHCGQRLVLQRTVLNLETELAHRALAALCWMELPEATVMLERWTPAEMALVPTGTFTMGSTESGDEGPVHQLRLPAYWLDRYPTTNAQWQAFLQSDAWERRELWTEAGWQWREDHQSRGGREREKENHPVVEVTWHESLAYARWAGKTLPSEAEWEKAASWEPGPPGRKRKYPWDDEFDKEKCNTSESGIRGTTPVGKYSPAGDSPYGCADMAGNVWEWCRSLYRPYPFSLEDHRDDVEASGVRVLRGGSFDTSLDSARCACRGYSDPDYLLDYRGVRCCFVPVLFSPQ